MRRRKTGHRIEGLFAGGTLCAEAQERTAARPEVWDLAEECFREAQYRIEQDIQGLIRNQDRVVASVGGKALSGRYISLTSGIIRRNLQDYVRRERILTADEENMRKVV